jgi:hypothetical protein
LKDKLDAKTTIKLQIFDAANKMIGEYKNLTKDKGVNRFVWNMAQEGARLRRPLPPEFLEFAGPPRGPQVVPGTYTAKLFVGDKLAGESKVEVRVDPTVNVTPAGLQAQFDLAMKLRDLTSVMNDGLRQLDSLQLQTNQIEAVAKDRLGELPPDLTKAFADYKKNLSTLLSSLATNPEDGIFAASKYADQLFSLYFSVSGGNNAPTATMKENAENLGKEFPNRIGQINKFVNEETANFNKVLQKNGLATLVPGKNVEPMK